MLNYPLESVDYSFKTQQLTSVSAISEDIQDTEFKHIACTELNKH